MSSPRLAWLVRLYPRSWRARYGQEFVALLDDVPPSARVAADIVVRAAMAHVDEVIVQPRDAGARNLALTQKGTDMIRLFLVLIALATTAMAAVGTLHAISFDSDASAFGPVAALSFAVPFVVGVLTVCALVVGSRNARGRIARLTALAALVLIPLGALGIAAVLAIGNNSGDYEWAIAATNAALIVQGALTYLFLSGRLEARGLRPS